MGRRQRVERPKHLQESCAALGTNQLHFLPGQPRHHIVPFLKSIGAAHNGSPAVRWPKGEQYDVGAQRQIPTRKRMPSRETAERESRTWTCREPRSFRHFGHVEDAHNAKVHI
jgi:hypothetical protein